MKKVVVLTGAGISAESGIQTFRGSGGLWEGHDVMEVASPDGWEANRELVLNFYNERRRKLKKVKPNPAHEALVRLEEQYDVHIITQNVDDLHERAGSTNILHLHGELTKARSTVDRALILKWPDDINLGDKCPKGSQLRPHIVWFGEDVPMLHRAVTTISDADIAMIVGTSMQVYPAAGLIGYAPLDIPVYYIDPNPAKDAAHAYCNNLTIVEAKAGEALPNIVDKLLSQVSRS